MPDAFEETFATALAAVPDEQRDESRFVGASGPLDADVVLVGEAPGSQEVERGAPFVGSAGGKLDALLSRAGIDRESVYVTNLVKGRPPENRDPHREEIDAWWPVLAAELERVDPAVVVALGAFASRELLDSDASLADLRGETYEGDGYVLVPTYHPAATFYDSDVEGDLQADLERVAELADAA